MDLPPAPIHEIVLPVSVDEISGVRLHYLKDFALKSPTFRTYWMRACKSPRNGAETSWNSLAGNSLMLLESYQRLLDGDLSWWRDRCPTLSNESLKSLILLSKRIGDDPEFYLMIYARDFGWMESGGGKYHQIASIPIIEKIAEELNFDSKFLSLWVKKHSVPLEVYLGEVAPLFLERLFGQFQGKSFDRLLLLSLLEGNSITRTKSALYEDNVSFILHLRDNLSQLRTSRLKRFARARLLHAKSSPKDWEKLEKDTEERYQLLLPLVQKIPNIEIVLETVNFHYIASEFPKMTPEGIAAYLQEVAKAPKKHTCF